MGAHTHLRLGLNDWCEKEDGTSDGFETGADSEIGDLRGTKVWKRESSGEPTLDN